MSRGTKFVRRNGGPFVMKIYQIFMVPKPAHLRLLNSMESMDMNTNWQTWEPSAIAAAFGGYKESKLKLSLETRNSGDVFVVHCHGRIVYRDEAAALSLLVSQVLQESSKLVLDLSGVTRMDSAGIGELALLQTLAQEKNASLKCAGANSLIRTLLDLTNLDSVLDVHPTLESALAAFREESVCADC